MERYFAVCRPLQSRTWQTLSHAYLTIAICWVLSGVVTIPIGTYTKLKSYHSVNKCREVWTSDIALKVYTISLNHILLLFPMIVMSIAYGLIMKMLWKGLQIETQIDKGKKWSFFFLHFSPLLSIKPFKIIRLSLMRIDFLTNENN